MTDISGYRAYTAAFFPAVSRREKRTPASSERHTGSSATIFARGKVRFARADHLFHLLLQQRERLLRLRRTAAKTVGAVRDHHHVRGHGIFAQNGVIGKGAAADSLVDRVKIVRVGHLVKIRGAGVYALAALRNGIAEKVDGL